MGHNIVHVRLSLGIQLDEGEQILTVGLCEFPAQLQDFRGRSVPCGENFVQKVRRAIAESVRPDSVPSADSAVPDPSDFEFPRRKPAGDDPQNLSVGASLDELVVNTVQRDFQRSLIHRSILIHFQPFHPTPPVSAHSANVLALHNLFIFFSNLLNSGSISVRSLVSAMNLCSRPIAISSSLCSRSEKNIHSPFLCISSFFFVILY